MALNKFTSVIPSTLLQNKIGTLLNEIQNLANPSGSNPDFATYESVISSVYKLLGQFYKDLSAPIFKPKKIKFDSPPDALDFNSNIEAISKDLNIVFNEFENLETVILGNFNYIISRLNRLNSRLKTVYSQTGDYLLLSSFPTKDALYFTDSFNSLDRIENNSPLLNNIQCEINQVEGIITLPIDYTALVPISVSELPVINTSSNGVAGNNIQAGAVLNSDISVVLDGNADTWFEYERVVLSDDNIPLILDLTINIGEEKIINFVQINPNNFGTRTQIEILSIDTSIDGKTFVSIKDDIPIADFTVEDEENVFVLAPSTSKYAGQGLYSFTPRKAKYIHLVFRQSTPYDIMDSNGVHWLRYAIGLKDIILQALPFKDKGEFISSAFTLQNDEIKKIALLSNQSPTAGTTSSLASITHHISPDNGQTWHEIRPKVSTGIANQTQLIPEILDFNGVSNNTITTSNPVNSIRYKAILSRNTEAFQSGNADLVQITKNTTELHQIGSTTPFNLPLQHKPIKGTLKVVDPNLGSRGKSDVFYYIATGTGSKKIIRLPFVPLHKDLIKSESLQWDLTEQDPQQIYVDGELWERSLTSNSNSTDKHYALNFSTGILEFGDGTTGKAPPSGAIISMKLSSERIFPTRGNHIASLLYPVVRDSKRLRVYIQHPLRRKSMILAKGAKRHILEPYITAILPAAIPVFSDSVVFPFLNRVDFVDGSSEFSGAGNQWSVDWDNGVVYSEQRTSTTMDTIVTFYYNPREYLEETDWSFVDDNSYSNAIQINDNKFVTFKKRNFSIPSYVRYINLEHLGILKGTIKFNSSNNVFKTEVEFIDGRTELLNIIKASEKVPSISVSSEKNIIFRPKGKMHLDPSIPVTFSDGTIFNEEVGSTPVSVGEYFVDRINNQVIVRVDESYIDAGSMTYFYANPQVVLEGRYSVNYNTGEIFTYTPTEPNLTLDYEYTNFMVEYDIAREINDWEFDENKNIVQIKDSEILKNQHRPQTISPGGETITKYYQVSYKYVSASREDIDQLEKYFTPVLKDYALKIIPKSKLV